jgi:subtilisin family serine protease
MRTLTALTGIILILVATIVSILVLFSLVSQAGVYHIGSVTLKDAPGMIRIAVVDTGLDLTDARFKGHLCAYGHKDFTGEGLDDTNGHGTHIAGLIQKYAGISGKYCMVIIKYYGSRYNNVLNELNAVKYATTLGVDFVNLSEGGPARLKVEEELIAQTRNTKFIAAAGNNGADLDIPGMEFYPASYNLPNLIAVGSDSPSSNHGSRVTAIERGDSVMSYTPNGGFGVMSGTSQAAAIHTGKLVRKCLSGDNY